MDEKAFAAATAAVTFVADIFGYLWHSVFQQPSVMNILYPGFWSNRTLMIIGLAGTVVGAYILGYVFAKTYNNLEKK